MTSPLNQIVIHPGYGGFSVSEKVMETLCCDDELCVPKHDYTAHSIPRDHPGLIEAIRSDPTANSHLQIMTIPIRYGRQTFEGPCFWKINEYDGAESIEFLDDKLELYILREQLKNSQPTDLTELTELIEAISDDTLLGKIIRRRFG